MQDEDRVRIGHMIEAAEDALRFIADRSRSGLDTDRMLLFALVRAVEIIGEAATKVSDETRNAHPGIPWKAVILFSSVDFDRTAASSVRERVCGRIGGSPDG